MSGLDEVEVNGEKLRGVLAVVTGRITACVRETMNWNDKRTGQPMSREFWAATIMVKQSGYYKAEVPDAIIDESGIFDAVDPEEDGPMMQVQVVISNDSREKATDVRMQYLRHAEKPRPVRTTAGAVKLNGAATTPAGEVKTAGAGV